MFPQAILKYKLPACSLIFLVFISYSQSFTTRLYTTTDGLSDNYIYTVYQDSYGYIWAGTTNGLSRFDGKRFLNYGFKQGLPSLSVDNVYEDHSHRLWIGTRSGMAELKGDSCYIYPVSDKQEISFVSGFLEPDPGILWATTNKGVYEFRNNAWAKISLFPGYENNSIGRIVKTGDGLFINYDNNKLVWRRLNGSYHILLSVQANHPYYNSLFQKNDTIYMGTYSGLKYWNKNKWITRFEDTLKIKYIYTSYVDNSNRFWFGTKQDGVLIVMPEGNRVNYLRIPLPINLVSRIIEDRDKNIWIASFRGLLKISPSSYRVFSLPGLDKEGSARNCIIMSSGNIIVSGENGKLLIIKPAPSNERPIQVIAIKQLAGRDDFIDFYTFDEKQRMWFTSRNGKLYRLDGIDLADVTSIIAPANSSLRGLIYSKIKKQFFVCGDSVLLTGNENRLDTFFGSNPKKIIPLPYKIFIEESNGAMLVQTVENGLFRVTGEGKVHALNKKLSLYLSVIDSAAVNKNEKIIWASNPGKGIARYLWKKGEEPKLLETITEKDGLSDNYVLDLAVDRAGKLWIATTKGITVMQKDHLQKWIHQDFEINESGTVIPLSFTKLAIDGKDNVWMNAGNKLVVFDSKKSFLTPLLTNTVIEKILLFEHPTNWLALTDSVDNYRQLPVNPILKHDQNTLSIIFNGLEPGSSDPSLLEYSYRLQPSDTDTAWSSPTASNIVSFHQLAAGSYRFEVRSHIKGFDWSEPALFSFHINKPYWETWWFRLVVILLASAMIVSIFRYRLKQLKTRSMMQNQIRELEMKALKAQMNPHFIHNALNSIQSLIINNRSNEASHYISKFAKLLRQVLENADKNIIALDKELFSLQLYVDLEKLRLNMDIDFREEMDQSIIASEIKIPPLILQPFVENALWHGLSNKEGNKKIIVAIKENKGWITCEITDNGIGRKKAARSFKPFPEGSFSKAVYITRQRLVDFNQSPGIEPVSFIDLFNNNEPAGTTVIIRIKTRSLD